MPDSTRRDNGAPPRKSQAPTPKHAPSRVVLAERARHVRTLLARELARDGHHVIAAASAKELFAALAQGGADAPRPVVLLDPELPGLDDAAATARLRAALRGAPLVVHSFGGAVHAPLAELTIATLNKDGDIEALRALLKSELIRARHA